MKITQWLRVGICHNHDNALGFNISGAYSEYEELLCWCIESFGLYKRVIDDGGRWVIDGGCWSIHITGCGLTRVVGCIDFKNEEDLVAFKLRWL